MPKVGDSFKTPDEKKREIIKLLENKEIFFVRHGESQAVLDKVYAGALDSPLTETGEKEASNLANFLQKSGFKPTSIITSSLQRSKRTAEIIKGKLNLNVESFEHARLGERDWGSWANTKKMDKKGFKFNEDNFYELYLEDEDEPYTDPESDKELGDRLVDAFIESLKGEIGENPLFVSHLGVMGILIETITGVDIGNPGTCEVFKIKVKDGIAQLEKLGKAEEKDGPSLSVTGITTAAAVAETGKKAQAAAMHSA